MFLIGLTGGIASGKSTVSRILKSEYHCEIIDADIEAREVVTPGKPAYNKIVKYFGREILHEDGTINRQLLGEIIFSDQNKRKLLNSVTHPAIAKSMLWKIVSCFLSGHKFVILDVPLLFETKRWLSITTFNVVVYCSRETQLKRLQIRDDIGVEDANKRIDSQMSLEAKKGQASHVINNNGELEETRKQINTLYKEFESSKQYLKVVMANNITVTNVRQYLKNKSIKLWLSPYTNEDGSAGDEIQTLAVTIESELTISVPEVSVALEELRNHSITQLKRNENFKNNGVATLKIRYTIKGTSSPSQRFVETYLTIDGKSLASKVFGIFDLDENDIKIEEIKLIYCGKIVQDDETLESQSIKHNGTILCVICPTKNRDKSTEEQKQFSEVEKATKGAKLLATKSKYTDTLQVDITDQNGRSLNLPAAESRALTVALGLHDKGRAVLKGKNYTSALLILLEADSHFRQCRSEILKAVDNYGVLCLDIVWCYVMLRDVTTLPDAKHRLEKCEESLKQSYGDSLTRLMTIKGNSGNEIALFVRLYILQAIVAYHNNDFDNAKEYLNKAEGYAGIIRVDVGKVEELMLLGFTATESRTALRSCNGDVGRATQYAFQQREEKEKIKAEEKRKRQKESAMKKYGKCSNGMSINPTSFEQLKSMGFEPTMAAEALKLHNNDLHKALDELQNNFDNLQRKAAKATSEHSIIQDSLAMLLEMGFPAEKAKEYLKKFAGDVEKVIARLTQLQNDQNIAGTSTSVPLPIVTDEERDLMSEAAQALDHDEKEYLDLTLDEESELISQYKAFLQSVEK